MFPYVVSEKDQIPAKKSVEESHSPKPRTKRYAVTPPQSESNELVLSGDVDFRS
jgi:hypothetical protein